MKKLIFLILMILLVPFINAYHYDNESGYNLDIDFANGGVQEQSGGYNTSSIIGESMIPFNDSTATYKINQGLYYIIWSNQIITDAAVILALILNIEDYGIEWVKLNFTS